MKAIVCEGPQPREGWALEKVSHAGICGTDLNSYAGTHPRAAAFRRTATL